LIEPIFVRTLFCQKITHARLNLSVAATDYMHPPECDPSGGLRTGAQPLIFCGLLRWCEIIATDPLRPDQNQLPSTVSAALLASSQVR
jgi:hypothetical protein